MKKLVAHCFVWLLLVVPFGVAESGGFKKVVWDDPTLDLDATLGTVEVVETGFRVQDKMGEAVSGDFRLWATPSIGRFVSSRITDAVETGESTVELLVSFPADAKPRNYFGAIFVREGKRGLWRPLFVRIQAGLPEVDSIPKGVVFPSDDRITVDVDSGAKFVRDEVLVGLSDSSTIADLQQLVSGLGGSIYGGIEDIDFYQVVFPSLADPSILDLRTQQLSQSDVTTFAARSWIAEALSNVPDLSLGRDPAYRSTFDANDVFDETQPEGATAPLEYTKFPTAWHFNKGSNTTKIAVVDSGFKTHVDLAANINLQNSELGDGDFFPHGTEVAGVLAASGNNTDGITGAMWEADLSLYAIGRPRFLGIPGTADEWPLATMIEKVQEAIRDGARVINLSGGARIPDVDTDGFKEYLKTPDAGRALFVVAAGNSDEKSARWPARLSSDFDNVISVTTLDFIPNTYTPIATLRGPSNDVDIAAPLVLLTTTGANSYVAKNGSSFAAPLVSGLAGLLLTQDPTLDGATLKKFIVEGAELGNRNVINPDTGELVNFFVLDAGKTMDLFVNPPPPPPPEEADLVTITARGSVINITEVGASAPTSVVIGDQVSAVLQYRISDVTSIDDQNSSERFYFFGESEDALFQVDIGALRWKNKVPEEFNFDVYSLLRADNDFYGIDFSGRDTSAFESFPGGGGGGQPGLNFFLASAGMLSSGTELVDASSDLSLPAVTSALSLSDCENVFEPLLSNCIWITSRFSGNSRWRIVVQLDPATVEFNGEPLFQLEDPRAEVTRVLTGDTDGKDIWTTSVFSSDGTPGGGSPGGGRNDEYLQVGGWGDFYHSLIQFDLTGLPANAESARIELYLNEALDSRFSPVGMWLDVPTEEWDWRISGTGRDNLRLWWADRPSVVPWSIDEPQPMAAPTIGEWYSIDITNLYNAWQSSATSGYQNFGIQLRPISNSQDMNYFRSSNSTDPSLRPRLIVTETE